MNELSISDIESLARGAAILGSGGGGDPHYERWIVQRAIEEHGPIPLRTVDSLTAEDLVLPVAYMGALMIGRERLPSGHEFLQLIRAIENRLGRRPTVLMPAEIGGANAFAPFAIAGKLGLPVLDADLLGRAFPEIHMASPNLHGLVGSPAFLADCHGNVVIVEAKTNPEMERLCREMTIAMGSNAALGLYLMSGSQARRCVVSGTVSQAVSIGNDLRQDESARINAILLGEGTIVDVESEIRRGFLSGSVCIACAEAELVVKFQNENLLASRNGRTVAMTPDIIIPVDAETQHPISCDRLQHGLRVQLLALPSPSVWRTRQGLELVGPQAFNYPEPYQSIETLRRRES